MFARVFRTRLFVDRISCIHSVYITQIGNVIPTMFCRPSSSPHICVHAPVPTHLYMYYIISYYMYIIYEKRTLLLCARSSEVRGTLDEDWPLGFIMWITDGVPADGNSRDSIQDIRGIIFRRVYYVVGSGVSGRGRTVQIDKLLYDPAENDRIRIYVCVCALIKYRGKIGRLLLCRTQSTDGGFRDEGFGIYLDVPADVRADLLSGVRGNKIDGLRAYRIIVADLRMYYITRLHVFKYQ